MPSFKDTEALNAFLATRSYIEGWSFSEADVQVFAKFPLPDKAAAPHAYRWYIHIAALTGLPSAMAAASSGPAPAASSNKKAKKAAPPAAAEEDIDLGFGDEEEIDLGFDEEEAPAEEKAPSMKERAAAAKAERDAKLEEAKQKAMERLAKKEAKQRSLCSLEIKPWEADQDLMALFIKIKETMVRDGLKWGENCQLVPVAFGIKKMLLTAVINQALSMDEIIEEMTEETFADEIQSMEMTSMSLL